MIETAPEKSGPKEPGYPKHIVIGWTHRDVQNLVAANGWARDDVLEVTPSNAYRLRGLRGPLDIHYGYLGPTNCSPRDRKGFDFILEAIEFSRAIFGEVECPTHATNWKDHI